MTGLWVPLVSLGIGLLSPLAGVVIFVGYHLAGIAAAVRWLRSEGLPLSQALRGAGVTHLSRLAHLFGMAMFWRRHLAGRKMEIIEYK
jgi:hypothetical protein